MSFFLLLNTKDILQNVGNQKVPYYGKVLWSHWLRQLVATFFQNIFFCAQQNKF